MCEIGFDGIERDVFHPALVDVGLHAATETFEVQVGMVVGDEG